MLVLAASCSDDIAPSINDAGGIKGGSIKGDGYIAVKINLPKNVSSRANNDVFEDGTSNEYKVNNAVLVIFSNPNGQDADEWTATQIGAYNLNDNDIKYDDPAHNENNNNTLAQQYLKAVKVSDLDPEATNWGLVLVNYDNLFSLSSATTENGKGMLTLKDGTPVNTILDLTKNNVNNEVAKMTGSAQNNFFMANAPLSGNAGGDVSPVVDGKKSLQLLVRLDDSLYSTPEAASAAPAGNFYVERAVAKATLTKGVTTATIGSRSITLGDVDWALSNTEPTSYYVRNIGNSSWLGYANDSEALDADYKYRFVGNTRVGKNISLPALDSELFRTYWCEDPQYNVANKTFANNVIYKYDENGKVVGVESNNLTWLTAKTAEETPEAAYCHENTFTVADQNHANTTRAILKVKMDLSAEFPGNTFCTVNGRQDVLYKPADAEVFAKNYIYGTSEIYNAIYNALNAPTEIGTVNTIENAQNMVVVQFARNAKGQRVVTSVGFNANYATYGDFKDAPKLSTQDEAKIIENVNKLYVINEYKNGVSYYDIWIKHFAGDKGALAGDDNYDLAPWTADDANPDKLKTENTADAYYGANAEQNWLGRYGMVRNNWYDIKVTAIKHLGNPEVTDITVDKTPDDEKDDTKWVSATINVLSWAKRAQSVEL